MKWVLIVFLGLLSLYVIGSTSTTAGCRVGCAGLCCLTVLMLGWFLALEPDPAFPIAWLVQRVAAVSLHAVELISRTPIITTSILTHTSTLVLAVVIIWAIGTGSQASSTTCLVGCLAHTFLLAEESFLRITTVQVLIDTSAIAWGGQREAGICTRTIPANKNC